jgi:hypothetical protein
MMLRYVTFCVRADTAASQLVAATTNNSVTNRKPPPPLPDADEGCIVAAYQDWLRVFLRIKKSFI